LLTPSPVDFLKRRVLRIYPAFLVSALVSALIVVPLASGARAARSIPPLDFVLQTLTLQPVTCAAAVFAHNAWPNVLNGSLWSIRIEFICYVGIMLLGIIGLLKRPRIVAVLLMAGIGWNLWLGLGHRPANISVFEDLFGNLWDWSNVLPCFLAGAVFHLCGASKLLSRRISVAAGIALAASRFIPHAMVLTLPICGTYLLMGVAYSSWLRWLNLGKQGDFSYGTYLYAYPVQQLIVQLEGGILAPVVLFVVAAPISVGLGALSWFLVERRFLKRSVNLKQGSVARAVTLPEVELKEA
jgi:peptidoglycan/LPS O-acetylase OafA/YrhL